MNNAAPTIARESPLEPDVFHIPAGAAIESFRNEVVKSNEQYIQDLNKKLLE